MPRRWAALCLALAVTIAACSPVSIRTPAVQPQGCMDALAFGTLVRDERTGLGLRGSDGTVTPVEWPFGYSARMEVTKIALIDERGVTVAHEGDAIQMGGGFGNDVWYACGPVELAKQA
jgi:hypothetical protein